eukprot:COSAG04_NODE_4712_length_1933_cov_6.598691_2_plen_59_part_00
MLERAAARYPHGKLDGQMLHTHHNQEGYGEGERICYAIVPLYRAPPTTTSTPPVLLFF